MTRLKPDRRDRREVRGRAPPRRSRGQRMLARLLEPGGQPQHVDSSKRPTAARASSGGFPSVSVPVLSTTSVSTFSSRSSASAFWISTPADAPRPVPTMIAIGVARPSAHGHAMIRTATALTSAMRQPRLRSPRSPTRRTPDRDRTTTAGTNHADTRRPAAGSARGCAAPRRPSGRSARAACRARRARPASRSCRCR